MSFFAAVVQSKVVTEIKEVPVEVPVVVYRDPEWLVQLMANIDIAAPFILAVIASWAHDKVKRHWPALKEDTLDWIHSLAVGIYVGIISLGYLAVKGDLDMTSAEAARQTVTLAFTGAAGRYTVIKAASSLKLALRRRQQAKAAAPLPSFAPPANF